MQHVQEILCLRVEVKVERLHVVIWLRLTERLAPCGLCVTVKMLNFNG